MTKDFVGQPLSVSLISGIEKVWTREWGEGKYQDFPSKIFCLTVTKDFVGQPLSVSLISGIEKFYASEVMSRSLSKIFCLTMTKKFVGQPLSVSLISGIEKFYASEVMSRFSVQKILSHSAEKFRRETL